jgi:predicted acetyltransferase
MHVEVIAAAPDRKSTLANMLELYGHDFSEFLDLEIGLDGRFGYVDLPLYWTEPGRHPFLIHVDGKLAGFVFVKEESAASGQQPLWDMAEFFVVRAYRRRGIGIQAAHEVWRRFPGPWQVRVMQSNASAVEFWSRAISTFTREPIQPVSIENGGKIWHSFSFVSKPYLDTK